VAKGQSSRGQNTVLSQGTVRPSNWWQKGRSSGNLLYYKSGLSDSIRCSCHL